VYRTARQDGRETFTARHDIYQHVTGNDLTTAGHPKTGTGPVSQVAEYEWRLRMNLSQRPGITGAAHQTAPNSWHPADYKRKFSIA
jgi:hypothetical protein